MKRQGHLFEKITDVENCKKAILNASKGKRGRRNVARVLGDIDNKARELSETIPSWAPSEAAVKTIYDCHRRKERTITCPRFFPDQCVHWAMMQVLTPIVMRGMDAHCCGSVPGRGVHSAKKHVERWLGTKDAKYCLYMDVCKCYESMPREHVMSMWRRKVKDPMAIDLIGRVCGTGKGFPIGFYTSQWFVNLGFEEMDHLMRERWGAKRYVRYMDDLYVFGPNKKQLHAIRREASKWLSEHGMELKGNWQVFRTGKRPVDFLGFTVSKGFTRLRGENFLRIARRARRLGKRRITPHDAMSMLSMLGALRHMPSHTMYIRHVMPYVTIKELKGALT